MISLELEIKRTNRRVHDWDKSINDLEEFMGQHEYRDRPIGNPLETDFTSATRKLNHISKRLGVDISNLGCVKLSLETVQTLSLSLMMDREANRQNPAKIPETTHEAMKEKIISLQDHCRRV